MAETSVLAVLIPATLRAELERLVLLELLGPAGGPDEEINEASVQDRYLVGMLAPCQKQRAREELDELAVVDENGNEDGTSDESVLNAATLLHL